MHIKLYCNENRVRLDSSFYSFCCKRQKYQFHKIYKFREGRGRARVKTEKKTTGKRKILCLL